MPKFINNFLIGCDPEFIGISEAGNLLNFANRLSHEGEIGYDHDGWVAEIRPAPAKGTYTLIKRIQKLILDIPKFRGIEKIRAGAYYQSIGENPARPSATMGGHIHINLNPFTANKQYTAAHHQRIGALDNLTQFLEAIDVLPKEESERRRTSSTYGRMGDVRAKGDMLNPRFEYRTMASWLYDPIVTMLCLTGAKLAAADPEGTIETLTPRRASFKKFKEWMERYASKDINAKRVVERIDKINPRPDLDFRAKWDEVAF